MKAMIAATLTILGLASNAFAREQKPLECALGEAGVGQKVGCDADCDDSHTTINGFNHRARAALGEGILSMKIYELGTDKVLATFEAPTLANQPTKTYWVSQGANVSMSCWVNLK